MQCPCPGEKQLRARSRFWVKFRGQSVPSFNVVVVPGSRQEQLDLDAGGCLSTAVPVLLLYLSVLTRRGDSAGSESSTELQ